MKQLGLQLVFYLTAKQIALNGVGIFVPWLKNKYKKRKLIKAFENGFPGMAKTDEERREQMFFEEQLILEKNAPLDT